jgi:hypothetical protein
MSYRHAAEIALKLPPLQNRDREILEGALEIADLADAPGVELIIKSPARIGTC